MHHNVYFYGGFRKANDRVGKKCIIMKNLTFSEMENSYAGNEDNSFLDIAVRACAVWGVGRAFFGVSISCVGSPLAGVICTGLVDALCATAGVASLM